MRRFNIPVAIPTLTDAKAAWAKAQAASELRTAKRAVRKAQREQLLALAAELVKQRSK